MPGDDDLLRRVKAALAGAPGIEVKRMFGGTTFMVRGRMCVSVGKGRIMCRIDPARHEAAIEQDGCRTVMMRGRPYRGFVHVDKGVLGTEDALRYWVGLALDYNKSASRKKG